MTQTSDPDLSELADLSDLLVHTVAVVVKSQEKLDEYTQHRQEIFDATPEGELAIPPLYYAISDVAIELELSTSFSKEIVVDESGQKQVQSRMNLKTLHPMSVGLYGYETSAGLRVRLHISPRGVVPIKANT